MMTGVTTVCQYEIHFMIWLLSSFWYQSGIRSKWNGFYLLSWFDDVIFVWIFIRLLKFIDFTNYIEQNGLVFWKEASR